MAYPIEVTVVKVQIGGTMAMLASDPLKNVKDYNPEKAIVATLLAAGAIKIIDLDAPPVTV